MTDRITFDEVEYLRVPSLNRACRGCAINNHPDPDCWEKVKCMDDKDNVHFILIHPDPESITGYVIAKVSS